MEYQAGEGDAVRGGALAAIVACALAIGGGTTLAERGGPAVSARQSAPAEGAARADSDERQPPSSTWGDGRTSRGPGPIQAPAQDQPYNWTHLGLAVCLMLLTLLGVLWLIRRSTRAGRGRGSG
jgi:hypothetical protein